MRKHFIKILTFVIIIILITIDIRNDTQAKGNKTRYSTILKSSSGKQYNIKLVGINDKSGVASWNSDKQYEMIWAGANEGDRIHYGNFQFYVNSKKSSQRLKKYTYNKTQKMVYKIRSRYKGQPDLLLVSSTETSNYRSASVYYMHNGKLKKAKGGLGNTLRPKNIGKYKFKLAVYDNASDTTGYIVEYYQFNVKKGTLTKYKTDFIEGSSIKW